MAGLEVFANRARIILSGCLHTEEKKLYVVRFKEFNFELTNFQDVFYTADRKIAEGAARDLTDQIKRIQKEIKDKNLITLILIPEIEVTCSTLNDLYFEVEEVSRLTEIPSLSYKTF